MSVSPYAGGIKAISRWLSEATPPELIASTIFESRRDSRLIRRFGVVSTMSFPGRVRSRWNRSDSTTSVPVASLALSHRLIADVPPGRQSRGGTPVFQAKKSFTALLNSSSDFNERNPGRRFAADAASLCPGLMCDGLSGRKVELRNSPWIGRSFNQSCHPPSKTDSHLAIADSSSTKYQAAASDSPRQRSTNLWKVASC